MITGDDVQGSDFLEHVRAVIYKLSVVSVNR